MSAFHVLRNTVVGYSLDLCREKGLIEVVLGFLEFGRMRKSSRLLSVVARCGTE